MGLNTATYVTATTDPLTGGIDLVAGRTLGAFARARASIAAAKNNNPQVLAPISAAPTWAISTAYGAGQIVRGTGTDALNLYYMAGSNVASNVEGTSAGSGAGPAGIGSALITDNTCRWIYVGKATATDSTTPFLSTATLTAATDDMNGYVQNISAATATAIGLTTYQPSTGGTFATEAWITGGLYGVRNAGRVNGSNSGSAASPAYNSNDERGSIAFKTNSRKWVGVSGQTSVFKNFNYEVIVNGRRLSESSLVYAADNTNSTLLINLSKFPEGPKTIEIRVHNILQWAAAFQISTESDAFVWPVENANRFRLALEGDSITQMAYVSGYRSSYWVERIIGDHLGCDHVYNNAQGGTGAINNDTTKTTYAERLPDITAFAPDVLFIGGFHNDAGNAGAYTSATRQAAVLAYLRAIRAALPNCAIAMVGAQLLQGESTAAGATTQYQVELDAKAAFDSFGDKNSLFIPLLTDIKTRLTSANGKHYLVTTAPYNDSHPIPTYYPYFGALIAEKIAAWMQSR
jgi:GDSL-like Lipase/Acylhydrolase family